MDYKKTTEEYYSQWLGLDSIIQTNDKKVCFIHSCDRNTVLQGYSTPFDLWIWRQPHQTIVSYGDQAAPRIELFKAALRPPADEPIIKAAAAEVYGHTPLHLIKYVYQAAAIQPANAQQLSASDYPQYLAFFKATNPACKDTGWLKDYFDKITSLGLCFGVLKDGILVSCTDAPGMPYMSDRVQEIGIHTRNAYRQKGYAADVCAACANEIIRRGKCPQWSTTIDNPASQKLAEKIGFRKLADVFTVTL